MSNGSSTDFIGRNRAPRVHISYEVETYGSRAAIELPFVMGVMADLSGKPKEDDEITPFEIRKFRDVNIDTFDDFLKSTKPRVAFTVPNTITGKDQLPVDVTFEKMSDFSAGSVAGKVLPELLKDRESLFKLKSMIDGKMAAENFTVDVLKNFTQLEALSKQLEEYLAKESESETKTDDAEANKGEG